MAKKPRNIVREVGQAVAKEAGYAVNDIRQKVVEKGWFDQTTTPTVNQLWNTAKGLDPEGSEHEQIEPSDLYGRVPVQSHWVEPENADWDNVRNVADDAAQKNQPDDQLSLRARWESHKQQAEQLYGHDDDLEHEIEH